MAELGRATFAASVRTDRLSQGAVLAADDLPRLVVPVTLTVTSTKEGQGPEQKPAGAALQLLGPGDVVGIAPTQVLRVFPAVRATDPPAEPNYLAAIEFDSPELPWLVSLDTGDTPRPWIALVVVPKAGGGVRPRPGSMLPWLLANASDLPPHDEVHMWAHAQAQGDADLTSDASADARATVSRLLCPTRLRPHTTYVAAVVPTYQAGVLAALRQNPRGAGTKPSWGSEDKPVELPVYHSWEFTTGDGGDFEALARQLKAVDASAIANLGRIEMRLAEGGLGNLPEGPLPQPLHTLLVSPREDDLRDGQVAATDGPIADKLKDAVDHDSDDLVVRPPRYGQWPAGNVSVHDGPAWYAELNLQPHHRVIARVGADLVRAQQEELVAEAQRQLGEHKAARRARDLLRLGEMTAARLHERAVANVSSARVVTTARPALEALTAGDIAAADQALLETMAPSGLARPLIATSFARLARRVATRAGGSSAQMRADFVTGSLSGALVALPADGAMPKISLDRTAKAFSRAGILDQHVEGIRVEQLVKLARPALEAQDHLVATFGAEAPIEIQHVPDAALEQPAEPAPAEPGPAEPEPDDGGVDLGGVVGPLRGDDGQLHFRLRRDGAEEEPAAPVEVAHVDAGLLERIAGLHLGQAPGLRHLRPYVREMLEEQPQLVNLDAVELGALRAPVDLPRNVADLRLEGAVRESVLTRVADATQPLLQAAQAEELPAAAERPVTDFVVDAQTVALAQAAAGAGTVVMQIDARDAVRSKLGLKVFGPVLRDQLTAEGQHEFDDVVATLGKRQVTGDLHFPAAPPRVTADDVAARFRPRLEARTTYSAVVQLRLPFATAGLAPSRVDMGFVPKFDAPLAARLQETGSKWILAGADKVPPNSVTVVMTNPEFVEALLVGANHELARELMWRDVPSDPRRTVFTRFWQTTTPDQELPEIHTWAGSLGENLQARSPYLCVLVRSPLLRRYPNARVQAAQGTLNRLPDGGQNFEPDVTTFRDQLFTGLIAPDISFVVLKLTEAEVEGAASPWFLLLGEPVTEPKFGLDASPSAGADSWRNLSWGDLGEDHAVLRRAEDQLQSRSREGVTWGEDSAAMARILHQDPFRLVLPAADFVIVRR